LVVAGLIVAVAPAGHPEPGLQPAGVLQPRPRADQGIKHPRLSSLLHLSAPSLFPCRHLIAAARQALLPATKNRKMVQASSRRPIHADPHVTLLFIGSAHESPAVC